MSRQTVGHHRLHGDRLSGLEIFGDAAGQRIEADVDGRAGEIGQDGVGRHRGDCPPPRFTGEEAKDYPRARRYGVMRHSAYRMAREARKFCTR